MYIRFIDSLDYVNNWFRLSPPSIDEKIKSYRNMFNLKANWKKENRKKSLPINIWRHIFFLTNNIMHAIVLREGFRKTKWKFKMEFSIKWRTMHWWFWRIRIGKTQTYALAKQLLWSLTCQAWRTCLVVFPLLRRKWEGGLRLDSRCGQLFVQITNGTWEVNGLLLCSIFGSLTLLVQVFSPPTNVVSNRSSICAA